MDIKMRVLYDNNMTKIFVKSKPDVFFLLLNLIDGIPNNPLDSDTWSNVDWIFYSEGIEEIFVEPDQIRMITKRNKVYTLFEMEEDGKKTVSIDYCLALHDDDSETLCIDPENSLDDYSLNCGKSYASVEFNKEERPLECFNHDFPPYILEYFTENSTNFINSYYSIIDHYYPSKN